MQRRQDPRALYAAYGASADMRAWDGRPMPTYDNLGVKVQAHWTVAALAAAGLDMSHEDPSFARVAAELINRDSKAVPPMAEHLYWQLRLWARMSAAVPRAVVVPASFPAVVAPPHLLVPTFATPSALATALSSIAGQNVDALLGPLLHQGERAAAEMFFRELGAAAMAALALRPQTWFLQTEQHGPVQAALERIGERFELLESDGQPRPEARLFRQAARLLGDLHAAAGSPS